MVDTIACHSETVQSSNLLVIFSMCHISSIHAKKDVLSPFVYEQSTRKSACKSQSPCTESFPGNLIAGNLWLFKYIIVRYEC